MRETEEPRERSEQDYHLEEMELENNKYGKRIETKRKNYQKVYLISKAVEVRFKCLKLRIVIFS